MLIRMKKRGLVREYDDKEDKRQTRLELTPKGKTLWQKTAMKMAGMRK
jgi:DNA-binding MarR family transcriptional regulator